MRIPLWHDPKEEPGRHKFTVYLHGCSGVRLCCLVRSDSPTDETNIEVLFFRFDGWFYETWQESVRRNRIISWCYYNDLAFNKPSLEV